MFYLKKKNKKQPHYIYNGRSVRIGANEKGGAGEWIARKQLHEPRRHQRHKLADFQDIVSWQNACDSRNGSLSHQTTQTSREDSPGKHNRYRFSLRLDAKGKLFWAIKALTENRHGFNVRGTGSRSDIFFSTVFLTSPINFVDRANSAVRLSSETFEIHKVLLRDVRASIR